LLIVDCRSARPNVEFGKPCKRKCGCERRPRMSQIDLNLAVLFAGGADIALYVCDPIVLLRPAHLQR
jgi:hypothetical protein